VISGPEKLPNPQSDTKCNC